MLTSALGERIGLGHTAEIYAWEEGTVLKLFREWFPLRAVQHEARIGRIVHASGLPAPGVGEIVEVEGRHGLVYERIVGRPMLEIPLSRPWALLGYPRMLAELQVAIHEAGHVAGMPSQHEVLARKIRSASILPADLRDAALARLDTLPEGNQLCHGDFHPDNVLITDGGPVVIDWIDATNGNPTGDVARSSLLMGTGSLPEGASLRWALNLLRKWFHRTYLRQYARLRPDGVSDLASWRVVNAAARLSEGIPEEQALLAFVRAGLTA